MEPIQNQTQQTPQTQMEEKINSINTKFFSVLDDFKKYYVYYNKNPEVDEFQNYYANSKSQLQSISKELVTITNNINNHIKALNKQMINDDIHLTNEKKKNNKLSKKVKGLENAQSGSEILIDESKERYNLQYYYNIELFIGIIIICTTLSKLFRPIKT
jgi:hypothetical protein